MAKEIDIAEKLFSYAQNQEMVDQHYTEHGRDLLAAHDEILKLRKLVNELAWPPGWMDEAIPSKLHR
jgi:hypothetical protein